MFGEFDGINGFDNHLTQFKVKLIAAIESEDVSTMMEFKFLSDDKIERSNEILKEKLTNLVSDKIDELLTYESIKSLKSLCKRAVRASLTITNLGNGNNGDVIIFRSTCVDIIPTQRLSLSEIDVS